MTKDLRIVVDTNVFISGLLGITDSPSAQILQAVRDQKVILVTSPLILEEVKEVICRPRIVKITHMSPQEQEDFIDELIQISDVTQGKQLEERLGRDIKDEKLLTCAYEAQADYIVTGDEDLLILKKYKDTKIITPRDLLYLLFI